MTIEDLWREIEHEAPSETKIGWIIRLARPQAGHQLFVALDKATGNRALLLRVTPSEMPQRSKWPRCQGLELFSVLIDSVPHFGVRLKDKSASDVFAVLAADVSERIAAGNPSKSTQVLLERLTRWQRFLSSARTGLSIEQQRALWGELHVLRSHFLPKIPLSEAVGGWAGPAAAHQDFQFGPVAVEVKTASGKQPQRVRITSERQLDGTGLDYLFLVVVLVDERDVAEPKKNKGTTLPELVGTVRTLLNSDGLVLDDFNGRLLEVGYFDVHANDYERKAYTVREERAFKVQDAFPRLVEADLPTGIGDTNYALDLVACDSFVVDWADLISKICEPAPNRRKTKKQ